MKDQIHCYTFNSYNFRYDGQLEYLINLIKFLCFKLYFFFKFRIKLAITRDLDSIDRIQFQL